VRSSEGAREQVTALLLLEERNDQTGIARLRVGHYLVRPVLALAVHDDDVQRAGGERLAAVVHLFGEVPKELGQLDLLVVDRYDEVDRNRRCYADRDSSQ
jgi:hypothetical protein